MGHDARGAILLKQKWSRRQAEARLANMSRRLICMEACVGAHHLSRKLASLGHDATSMPAKHVRPYSKGQKNEAEAHHLGGAGQRTRLRTDEDRRCRRPICLILAPYVNRSLLAPRDLREDKTK